jgi:ABC-type nitrate/sulfonate/bicarbonate transport system substrate-binding protein
LAPSSAGAQDKPKIYFGSSSKTLGYGPLWAAVKRGFLEQQGLDGQLVLLRGTPMNVQALAAGSLQVGSGGPEAFYEATERGLDLVMTGGSSMVSLTTLLPLRSTRASRICAAPSSDLLR